MQVNPPFLGLNGSRRSISPVAFINGIMDRMVYLDILKNNLQKNVNKVGLGSNFIFQQGNDLKHRTKNNQILFVKPLQTADRKFMGSDGENYQ